MPSPLHVSIHYLSTGEASPHDVEQAHALLDPDERARAARFLRESDRTTFVLAHGLVRATLASRLGVQPRALRFEIGERGRPELARSAAHPHLRFNLSHTNGVVVLAVTDEGDIGIDVEDTQRRAPLDVAQSHFAPSEHAALCALPHAAQSERFFVYWTLKESYIKARGLGLAIPLDRFAFDRLAPEIAVSLAPDLGDDASSWWFSSWMLGERHRVALAVRAQGRSVDVRHPLR